MADYLSDTSGTSSISSGGPSSPSIPSSKNDSPPRNAPSRPVSPGRLGNLSSISASIPQLPESNTPSRPSSPSLSFKLQLDNLFNDYLTVAKDDKQRQCREKIIEKIKSSVNKENRELDLKDCDPKNVRELNGDIMLALQGRFDSVYFPKGLKSLPKGLAELNAKEIIVFGYRGFKINLSEAKNIKRVVATGENLKTVRVPVGAESYFFDQGEGSVKTSLYQDGVKVAQEPAKGHTHFAPIKGREFDSETSFNNTVEFIQRDPRLSSQKIVCAQLSLYDMFLTQAYYAERNTNENYPSLASERKRRMGSEKDVQSNVTSELNNYIFQIDLCSPKIYKVSHNQLGGFLQVIVNQMQKEDSPKRMYFDVGTGNHAMHMVVTYKKPTTIKPERVKIILFDPNRGLTHKARIENQKNLKQMKTKDLFLEKGGDNLMEAYYEGRKFTTFTPVPADAYEKFNNGEPIFDEVRSDRSIEIFASDEERSNLREFYDVISHALPLNELEDQLENCPFEEAKKILISEMPLDKTPAIFSLVKNIKAVDTIKGVGHNAAITLAKWGSLVLQTFEQGKLTNAEVVEIFTAQKGAAKLFGALCGSGHPELMTVYGNLLIKAFQSGALEKEDVLGLIQGSLFSPTGSDANPALTEAYGKLVLDWHKAKILTQEQMLEQLGYDEYNPKFAQLVQSNEDVNPERITAHGNLGLWAWEAGLLSKEQLENFLAARSGELDFKGESAFHTLLKIGDPANIKAYG